ncbi:MAG TPA: hypothetical protein VFD85_12760 [Gemmatimonadales bacterium]|nr:hypothetical protein [Gemmatimonadales bacterium]
MSIFDLLFLLAVLTSVVTLATTAVLALRGRRTKALRMLRVYAVGAAGYLAAGAAVSFFEPQRVISVGDPWCFDDWCLTVEKVERTPAPSQVAYTVALRIFSRARRVSQRARGAWIYLVDDRGRLYAPDSDRSAIPMDVLLRPEESVTTLRVFEVPADVRRLGLVTGHGGPYCGPMNILIIGEGSCLFKRPTMVRIQ